MVKKVFAALFALAFTASAWAQDNTELSLATASTLVDAGAQFTVDVNVTNNTPDGVFGWSYAVAHDASMLQIDMAVQGDLSGALPMGFPAAFQEVTTISNASGDGFINATILSLTEGFFYPGNGTNLIGTATYTNLMANNGDTTDVTFVDGVLANLPSPPVAIGVSRIMGQVDEVGSGLGGTMTPLTIENSVPPPFEYSAGNVSETIVLGSGDAVEAVVDISIEQINPFIGNDPVGISAAAFSVSHDDTQVEVASIDPTALTSGADTFMPTINADSFQLLVDVGLSFPFTVAGVDAAASVTYVPAGAPVLMGGESFASALTFDAAGNEVTAIGATVPAQAVDGSVEINAVSTLNFIRSDCNDDGIVNIADGITIIQGIVATMSGSGGTDCAAACDSDGDGMILLNDAILSIAFALGLDPANLSMIAPGAAVLADPGAVCGQFAGQTPQDCQVFNSCP